MSKVGRGSGRPAAARKYQDIEQDAPQRRRRRIAVIQVPLNAEGAPDLVAMRNQEMAKALEDVSTFELLMDIAQDSSARNSDRIAAVKEIHRIQELGIKMQLLAAGLDGEGGPVGSTGDPVLRALQAQAEAEAGLDGE